MSNLDSYGDVCVLYECALLALLVPRALFWPKMAYFEYLVPILNITLNITPVLLISVASCCPLYGHQCLSAFCVGFVGLKNSLLVFFTYLSFCLWCC
jgi:hypothetical protein